MFITAKNVTASDIDNALDAAFFAVIGRVPGHGMNTAEASGIKRKHDARLAAAVDMAKAGMTATEIARNLKVTPPTVRQILCRAGMKARDGRRKA